MNLFKKSDDEKIKAVRPDNFGWLEKKLSDKEMEYLWKCVDNRKGSKKSVLAGQIHESNTLVDKGDWFWQHTLTPLCLEYYKKFVLPRKKYRAPNNLEREGFVKLIKTLETLDDKSEAEEIQTKVYEIGMELKFSNLKDWFSGFYQVILGQEQGPRLGSFIKFYGLKKTIELLKEKVN